MKKRNVLAAVMMTAVLAVAATGCGSSTAESTTETATEQSDTEEKTQENQRIAGQITAIDGNDITIALADMGSEKKPENMPEAQAPNGKTDGEAPDGDKPDAEKPDGEIPREENSDDTETMVDENSGMRQLQLPSDLTLTGEEQTITVSDTTTYTLDGESATLTDLSAGDMIMVELDGEEVLSITRLSPGQTEASSGETSDAESTENTSAVDNTAEEDGE